MTFVKRARYGSQSPSVRFEPPLSMGGCRNVVRRSTRAAAYLPKNRPYPIRRDSAKSIRPTRRSWCSESPTSGTRPSADHGDAYAQIDFAAKYSQISGDASWALEVKSSDRPLQVDPSAGGLAQSTRDCARCSARPTSTFRKHAQQPAAIRYTLEYHDQLFPILKTTGPIW